MNYIDVNKYSKNYKLYIILMIMIMISIALYSFIQKVH